MTETKATIVEDKASIHKALKKAIQDFATDSNNSKIPKLK